MKDHFFSSTLPSFATPPCSLPHPILFCLQVDEVSFQGPKGSSQRRGSSRRKKPKHKRKCERAVVSAVVPQEKNNQIIFQLMFQQNLVQADLWPYYRENYLDPHTHIYSYFMPGFLNVNFYQHNFKC